MFKIKMPAWSGTGKGLPLDCSLLTVCCVLTFWKVQGHSMRFLL